VSERTRARMARWTPEQRLAYGLASLDAWFDAAIEVELAKGLDQEAAAEAVRARIRTWRSW
jgi:hypothetical protein